MSPLPALDGAASDRDRDDALVAVLDWLKADGYRFVTPTPWTHGFVRDRTAARSETVVRDVLGWCRPFEAGQMPGELFDLLSAAGVLDSGDRGLGSTVRVSTVDGRLHAHTAPTRSPDAVFLGPDSYRYARFLRQVLDASPHFERGLDIGVGAGVGALVLLGARPMAEVTGSDVNPQALRLSSLNARHAGLGLRTVLASGVPAGEDGYDLIIANPPFIAGDGGRTYRDGGDMHGAALALDWARAALDRLRPGGRFVLYTGAPIVEGGDIVRDTLGALARERGMDLSYDEIDPDIFSRTLRQEAYADVERIAAIGAVVTAP